MKAAVAWLGIGAVAFFLYVLTALVMEGMRLPRRAAIVYLAKFKPSRPRRELILMDPDGNQRRCPAEPGEQMAI